MSAKQPLKKDIAKLIRPEVRRLAPYRIDETPVRIKLDAMENPFPLPADAQREIAEAIASASLNRYPDPSAARLKEAIAELWGIGTKRMILGNGSDELIQMIVLAFGGPVLVPVPTFTMYDITSRALAQEVVTTPLTAKFDLDAGKVLKKAKETKAKVIFLADPNNPTGNRFSDEAVYAVLTRANAAVVIDEAYFSFCNKSFLPVMKDFPNMIILRTLSKIGLAGLRIGVLTASGRLIDTLGKVRLPYNINALSQAAATVVLRRRDVLREQISLLISGRERLYNALLKVHGITVYASETNFILFRTTADATRIYEKLKEAGILIKDLNRPGALKNCLRVTVGTPDENKEFLAALEKITGRK